MDRPRARSSRSRCRYETLEKEAGGRGNLDRDELIEALQEGRPRGVRRPRGRGRRGGHARARAPRAALGARPQVARAPLRDGLPARGHLPARLLPARPAGRVPARGLRHVRRDDGRHQGGGRRLPVQPRGRRRGRRGRGPRKRRRSRSRCAAEVPSAAGRRDAAHPGQGPRGALAVRRTSPTRPRPSRARSRSGAARSPRAPTTPTPNVGRNALCPCGSGKKYKKCHGAPGGPTGLTARANG